MQYSNTDKKNQKNLTEKFDGSKPTSAINISEIEAWSEKRTIGL